MLVHTGYLSLTIDEETCTNLRFRGWCLLTSHHVPNISHCSSDTARGVFTDWTTEIKWSKTNYKLLMTFQAFSPKYLYSARDVEVVDSFVVLVSCIVSVIVILCAFMYIVCDSHNNK